MRRVMKENLLEIKDLHVQYITDDAIVHALNGFNITLKKGETLGLVGETGAGKTTMALSILRLLPPRIGRITQGSIVYEGREILNKTAEEMLSLRGEKISMIFQDPMTSLNPVMTVGDQIAEVLDLHFPELSNKEREGKVEQMLRMVGIPPARKGEYPHQFSGGMKQRIVIAMALIAEPDLLLADEPTTALDVTIQAQILELIRQLKVKFNSAMILITHDLGVVADVCDNVAIAYAGEVIEHGPIDTVYLKTKNHPYTQGLFNSIPELSGRTSRLDPIPGFMVDPTNLPSGCSFAPRCSYCMDICRAGKPPTFSDGTHSIKCYLYREGVK
jgi:peptide/nickel transport system ATP-binding protein